MRAERWVFDRFELLPSRGELRRQGEPVAIAAKPLAVLCELIRHRDRAVTREELLAAVWPGLSVSDAAFTSVIRDLRRVLGESGAAPRFVATLRGKGFRFVHPVLALPATDPLGEDDPKRLAAGDAWSAAAAHFEAALRALDRVHASRGAVPESPLVVRERGDLLVALARARWAGGSTEAARAAFLDAADAARRFGDVETLARASLGFAGRTDVTPHVSRESVPLLEEALGRLGSANPPLRAELLARLGTELHREGDGSRADALTREAVAEAERAGDPSTLAYVLTARHFVLQRPDVSPRQRIALTDRVFEIAGEGPPSDVLALALQERLLDLLELGEGRGFEETFGRYAEVVGALDQPFFTWIHALFVGCRSLLAGRLADAERDAAAALALGRRLGTANAASAFAAQLFALRLEQGRLGELLPLLLERAREHAALPIFRAAVVAATAAAGRPDDAEAALRDVMAHDLADFPRDHHWLGVLALLAPAAAAARDESWARRLLALFAPCAGRIIVVGYGAATLGAADHHLATLALRIGEQSAARRQLEAAEQLHEKLGASCWRERTCRERTLLSDTPAGR